MIDDASLLDDKRDTHLALYRTRANSLDERTRIADQRIISGEIALSRLRLLIEDRREFGLNTAQEELLLARNAVVLQNWNNYRDTLL